jgi:hypothetical protein
MNTITNDVQSVIKSCQGRAESDRVCPRNDYYVYALLAPGRTHEVFYIGKGRGRRCDQHFQPSGKGWNSRKDAIIAKYPGCYAEKIAENLSEKQALALEIHLIARAPKGCLANMTIGGDGTSGRVLTNETKAKISKAHKGKKGKPWTDEKRAEMLKVHKGKIVSDETRAKLSKARKGKKLKPFTDAARANMSKAHKGLRSSAKLTWAMVDEIRERLAAGEKTASIAREYSVCPQTICGIKNNKTWVRSSMID